MKKKENHHPRVQAVISEMKSLVDLHANSHDWHFNRRFFLQLLTSHYYDAFLGIVILLNMLLMVVETDWNATNPGFKVPMWMSMSDFVLMVIYLVEITLRLYVWQCKFFYENQAVCFLNLFDLMIISVDSVCKVIAFFPGAPDLMSIAILRMFRLTRLGRAVHLLYMFPELALMLKGFAASTRTIFWGVFMITCFLSMWSIAAVQVLHPINLDIAATGAYDECPRCEVAYSTVFRSIVTFLQTIIAGDSWGAVSIPIIELHPWTLFIFVGVYASVGMGLMNLMLAVVVECAQQARKEGDALLAKLKSMEKDRAVQKLRRLCESMDLDKSGSISFKEIKAGWAANTDFRGVMTVLDVRESDLETMFQIMDRDQSGSVAYDEFCEELQSFESDDIHTMIMFIKHYTKEMHAYLANRGKTSHAAATPSLDAHGADDNSMVSVGTDSLVSGPSPLRTRGRQHSAPNGGSSNVYSSTGLTLQAAGLATATARGSSAPHGSSAASAAFHHNYPTPSGSGSGPAPPLPPTSTLGPVELEADRSTDQQLQSAIYMLCVKVDQLQEDVRYLMRQPRASNEYSKEATQEDLGHPFHPRHVLPHYHEYTGEDHHTKNGLQAVVLDGDSFSTLSAAGEGIDAALLGIDAAQNIIHNHSNKSNDPSMCTTMTAL